MSAPSGTPVRARAGISDIHKKALRAWYKNQEPRPSHAACLAWFEQTYARRINQSTVSLILSKRYEHLDTGPASSQQRQCTPQWPLLEKLLSEWLVQAQEAGENPTGDGILNKARELWPDIIEYEGYPMPHFSQGWLSKFKRRHSARQNPGPEHPVTSHNNRKEVRALRSICGEFLDEDIYNMDETGLLWRKAPYDAIIPTAGQLLNKDKSRVCLVLCTNCTGSDRLPLWMIGHKEMPDSLSGVNLKAMEVEWRHSRRAWMTLSLMQEWLLFFYQHVGDRRVLLLLDDFQVHQTAIETTPPPANVLIQIVPTFPQTLRQPLTLGVTFALKQYYRKQWLSYIVTESQLGHRPIAAMSLYHALCWISTNWRHDLMNTTIYKSFRKSTLLDPQIEYLYAPKPPDLTQLYEDAIKHNTSGNPPMKLEDYSSLIEEDFVESNEAPWYDDFSNTAELDEPVAPVPRHDYIPPTMEALKGVQTAIRFMQHQSSATVDDLRDLARIEKSLSRKLFNEQE